MFSCTIFLDFHNERMAVFIHMTKTKYCLLPLSVQLFISLCLINAAQRDEIKSHVAKLIGYYRVEMINTHMQYHLQSIMLHEKQVWLSGTR